MTSSTPLPKKPSVFNKGMVIGFLFIPISVSMIAPIYTKPVPSYYNDSENKFFVMLDGTKEDFSASDYEMNGLQPISEEEYLKRFPQKKSIHWWGCASCESVFVNVDKQMFLTSVFKPLFLCIGGIIGGFWYRKILMIKAKSPEI